MPQKLGQCSRSVRPNLVLNHVPIENDSSLGLETFPDHPSKGVPSSTDPPPTSYGAIVNNGLVARESTGTYRNGRRRRTLPKRPFPTHPRNSPCFQNRKTACFVESSSFNIAENYETFEFCRYRLQSHPRPRQQDRVSSRSRRTIFQCRRSRGLECASCWSF